MGHIIKILKIEKLSENIKKFTVEKPENYQFIPGQHTLISINKPELRDKRRPFSFSSPTSAENIEFIIKIYPERDGFTKKLNELKSGEELIINNPRGKISYKGEGTFITAGTGISPFLSIFRNLEKEKNISGNSLFYMNKTEGEIIQKDELKKMFGDRGIFTLTRESKKNFLDKRIDKDFLKGRIKNFSQRFYICGPLKWIIQLKMDLIELGAKEENIISEI